MIQIRQFQRLPALAIINVRLYSTKKDAEKVIPKNLLEDKITAKHQPNGTIIDNKPFRIKLEAGKQYSWCLCGQSKSQPLCDGTHKYVHFKIKERPIRYARMNCIGHFVSNMSIFSVFF